MSMATSERPLTDQQERVFKFIIEYTKEHGYQPSIRDMMRFMGFKSPAAIMCHLAALRKKGFIELSGGEQSRALKILKRFKIIVVLIEEGDES